MKKSQVIPERNLKNTTRTIVFSRPLMVIESIGYQGLYRLSRLKNWALSWAASSSKDVGKSFYNRSVGEFLLADLAADIVTARGKMLRPNKGSIADNGTFSLESWIEEHSSAVFNVFDCKGNPIIIKKLTASIVDSGVSRNGRLAFCKTNFSAVKNLTEHADKIFLFDLEKGEELFCVTPEMDIVNSYSFDEVEKLLIAHTKGGRKFIYNEYGVLVT
ncbi:hypothetical protein [Pseudomonas nunensis]|uniref:Uncharacterized protein n=1 Tax=Pseudomonas nunensis TaxID=2961896 RepID=A0ABY5EJ34_9PSED|nr:hypothetical protein [Pseudomonas nunensis]MCL5230661.1 hypothetical protein [Pseudomonas nunensis]UTO15674.1 hypothetical protein NK667_04730 [Pseudomonas nunensis]